MAFMGNNFNRFARDVMRMEEASSDMKLREVDREQSAKDHGRTNQIEGRLLPGQKVVVIEDLISTGGSAVDTVEVLRAAGAEVLGIASIFTYGMQKGLDRFAEHDVKNVSLSDLDALVEVAADTGYIKAEDKDKIIKFRNNPSDEGWMKGDK